ncbi:hypothetical protein TNCV_104251 [Trichonephila clavipes]|nr:hypothetical protein TNCV_104251 [Trichonephila clavipes]
MLCGATLAPHIAAMLLNSSASNCRPWSVTNLAEFSSSNFHEGTQIATINTRFVYAMRSIGKGAEAGENVLRRNESSATTYKVFSLR